MERRHESFVHPRSSCRSRYGLPCTDDDGGDVSLIGSQASAVPLAAGKGVVILDVQCKLKPAYCPAVCVRGNLERTTSTMPIISARAFRDALSPWFETETMPVDEEKFAELLDRPFVAERLASLGVGYVVTVESFGHPTGGRNPAASGGRRGLAAGIGSAKISTTIQARLWDVTRRTLASTLTCRSRAELKFSSSR